MVSLSSHSTYARVVDPQLTRTHPPRILSYLFAAHTTTNYKWGFFALGTLAWLLLAFSTLIESRRSLLHRDDDFGPARGHHAALSGWANLLWLNYIVAFIISDGANIIGVTGGFIYFGILDLLMVPVLAAAFHFLARKWDYGRMGLVFTQGGRVGAGHPGGFLAAKELGGGAPVGGLGGAAGNGAGHPVGNVAV